MEKFLINISHQNTKKKLFERMNIISNTEYVIDENFNFIIESFNKLNELYDSQGNWVNPDVDKEEHGNVMYDDDVPKENSGFCQFNPEIHKFATKNSDNLAMTITFVIVSQRVGWDDLVTLYPEIIHYIYTKGNKNTFPLPYPEDSPFKKILLSKTDSLKYIWENKNSIYSSVMSILKNFNYYDKSKKSEEAAFELFKFLGTTIPRLGLPKSGFATQMIIGRSGCIDSINSRLFTNIPSSITTQKGFKTMKGASDKTIDNRIKEYTQYLNSIKGDDTSRFLWDKWTEIISNKILFSTKGKNTFVNKDGEKIDVGRYNKVSDKYLDSEFSKETSPQDISQQHNPEYLMSKR